MKKLLEEFGKWLGDVKVNTANTLINNLMGVLAVFGISVANIISNVMKKGVLALEILSIILLLSLWGYIRYRKAEEKKQNPYTPWTPVTPPNFAGRKRHLNQLEQALKNSESISIVGDRRIGKTSVLRTWEEKVRAQERVVVFVSGENAEAAALSRFVNEITKKQGSDKAEDAADILSDWADKEKAEIRFPPSCWWMRRSASLRICRSVFFERLRGMLGRVVWIFATREDIDLICRRYHDTSPFENRLSLKRLGLLEPEAVEEIIRLGKLTRVEVRQMHIWAGRHPFFLQLLGRCLIDARDDNITTALDEFYTEAKVRLRRVWKTLSEAEKEVLKGNAAGSSATLRSLRVRGLMTEDGKLFGKVLEEWLKEEEI